MKHLLRVALAALVTLGAASLLAEPTAPGHVDFGKFSPSAAGGEFVEVRLNHNIISMVSRIAEREEPEVGKLLRGLESIRVNVMGLDQDDTSRIQKRVEKIEGELDERGWDRVVRVRDKENNISVFVKTRGNEAVEGLFVSVLDGKSEAVLVNIVGDIRPEQLAMVGEKLNIEPLKKVGEALN